MNLIVVLLNQRPAFSLQLKLLKQYLLFVFSSYVTNQGSARSLVMQDSQSSFPCSGFGLISLLAT